MTYLDFINHAFKQPTLKPYDCGPTTKRKRQLLPDRLQRGLPLLGRLQFDLLPSNVFVFPVGLRASDRFRLGTCHVVLAAQLHLVFECGCVAERNTSRLIVQHCSVFDNDAFDTSDFCLKLQTILPGVAREQQHRFNCHVCRVNKLGPHTKRVAEGAGVDRHQSTTNQNRCKTFNFNFFGHIKNLISSNQHLPRSIGGHMEQKF